MVRQTILLDSSNKANARELNNDISLKFPNTLFLKSPISLELMYLNIEYDKTIFGNTNNELRIKFKNRLDQIINKKIVVDYYAVPLYSESLEITVYNALINQLNPFYNISFDIINKEVNNIRVIEYNSLEFVNIFMNEKIKKITTHIFTLLDEEIIEDYKISFKVKTNEITDIVIRNFNLDIINNPIFEQCIISEFTIFQPSIYYRISVEIDIQNNRIENCLIGWFETGELFNNDINKYPIEGPATVVIENIIYDALSNITTELYDTFSTNTKRYTIGFDVTSEDITNIKFINYTNVVTFDIELRDMVDLALNSQIFPYYDIEFSVLNTNIEKILTNYEVEQDLSTTLLTIYISNDCTLNFNIKDSIGPILGLGNGTYENKRTITGTSTPSIEALNLINVFNVSGNQLFAHSIDPTTDLTTLYPNYDDINCKMELYDSDNNLIENIDDGDLDVAISINKNSGNLYYANIGNVLSVIQDEMNRYSNNFTPPADFLITYNPTENKITIVNKTGAKFGIGFDFYKFSNNIVTGGSLHKILGFNQKQYLSVTTITSVKQIRAFSNLFPEEYLLFCSDLANGNTDINTIGIGNNNNVKANNILYSIPISKAESFQPVDSSYYSIDIRASIIALGYAEKKFSDENPLVVNFYLRLSSGTHLKSNMSWSCQLALNYSIEP